MYPNFSYIQNNTTVQCFMIKLNPGLSVWMKPKLSFLKLSVFYELDRTKGSNSYIDETMVRPTSEIKTKKNA